MPGISLPEWQVEIWEVNGGPIVSVPFAQDRQYQNGAEGASFSFSLDMRDDVAKRIRELSVDIVVYRDGVKFYRGRCMTADLHVDADQRRMSVTSVDYKQFLKKRVLIAEYYDSTWSSNLNTKSVGRMCWDVISRSQTTILPLPNGSSGNWGDLGLTLGLDPLNTSSPTSGSGWVPKFDAGTDAFSFIESAAETAALTTGASTGTNPVRRFEWIVDAEKTMRFYEGTQYGRLNPVFLLDFGGSVLSFETQTDVNSYANHWICYGGAGVSSYAFSNDAASAQGLISQVVNDSNITHPAVADNMVLYSAAFNGQLDYLRSYSMELSPFAWKGPSSLWLGDYVYLDLVGAGLDVKRDNLRVLDISITIEDTGYERIAINVGYAPSFRGNDLYRASRFVANMRKSLVTNRTNYYTALGRKLKSSYAASVKRYGKNHAISKAYWKQLGDVQRDATKYTGTQKGITSQYGG